jgi:uncharacterized membrane protein
MTDTQTQQPVAEKPQVNALAVLSYISILFIVPLVVAKDDLFVKFHVKQGIVLFIGEVILWVIMMIPFLGWVVGFIGQVIAVILAIMGIVNVLQGKEKELPLIGKYAANFKI